MGRRRNRQRQPVIGGAVGEDNTKQGRRRRARQAAVELGELARKQLKIPTTEEVQRVNARSKER